MDKMYSYVFQFVVSVSITGQTGAFASALKTNRNENERKEQRL
jgi:hypothetical protein